MDFFKFLKTRIFLRDFIIASVSLFVIIWITLWCLDIYTQNGKYISVPNFLGLSKAEVEKLAEENSLRFEITDSVYINTKKRGTIVEQSPTFNFKVKENRTIFLTINALNAEKVPMPKLIGITLRQASSTLETYGLKVGKISYEPDIAKNVVLKQQYKGKEITPNSSITKGESIDLVLGLGESNEKTKVPALIGISFPDVESLLNESSLNLGSILCDETIILASDSAISKIWKQYPGANTDITLGSSVDIWITTNPSIIRTASDTTGTSLDIDF